MLVTGSKFRSHKMRSYGRLVHNIVLAVNNMLLTANLLRAGRMAQQVKVLAVHGQCPDFDLWRPLKSQMQGYTPVIPV